MAPVRGSDGCFQFFDAGDAGQNHSDLWVGQEITQAGVDGRVVAVSGQDSFDSFLFVIEIGEAPRRAPVFAFGTQQSTMQGRSKDHGGIGIDGCSLTVGETVDADGRFQIHLIPETLAVTTIGALQPGDRVNIELDSMTQAVVETVERVMAQRG